MARRTETKPEVGAPPPIVPPGPWPAPPEERRSRLGWAALAFVVVVALAAGGWFALGHRTQHHQPTPGNSASPPGGTPSLPAPVAATTYEAFAALPADQQQALMLEVMNRFNEIVNQSSERLDASVLPLVATGDELGALKQRFQTLQQSGYGLSTGTQVTVLRVVMSPQPYSFVSIHIQSTETAQYVKPTTLEPVGSPAPATSVTSSFSFVIEDGTWKASEHFQDFTK